ncbi:MAG: tetratricopeptide repeat protein, partial [Nitrospirae bacterium]
TLFYLLTVLFYIRFRTKEPPIKWWFYGLALLSSTFAMLSKEIAFTLPVVLVLMEYVFFKDRRNFNWWMVLPFFLTALLVPLQHISFSSEGILRATEVRAQWFTWPRDVYFYTEMSVLLKYWALIFWPSGLRFYYGWPEERSPLSPTVIGPALFHLVLISLSIWAIYIIKKRSFQKEWAIVPFSILWFYIALSVESSFIPIPDFIFEHRLYLPLAGVSMGLGLLLTKASRIKRLKYPVWALVMVVLVIMGWKTYERNTLWANDIAFWKDNIKKEFDHVAPYFQLGIAYQQRGMHREAIETFNIAAQLRPDYYAIYELLGVSYERMNFLYDAVKQYEKALSLEQKKAIIWAYYARALRKLGRTLDAVQACRRALILSPVDPEIRMICR